MKTKEHNKIFSLVAAIVIAIVVLAALVPTVVYFVNNKKPNQSTPTFSSEVISSGFNKTVTINSKQLLVSEKSFFNENPLQVSAKVNVNSNVKTILRVKISLKLSNTNSSNMTSANLQAITSGYLLNINEDNWTLGSTSGTLTSASSVTDVYLYYNSTLVAGEHKNIEVFSNISYSGSSGSYVVAAFSCESVEAQRSNALKWLSQNRKDWENSWLQEINLNN